MTSLLNDVGVLVETTGQGDIVAGAAISDAYFTPSEAGAVDGASYYWKLTEGNDVEFLIASWTASTGTVNRSSGTTLASKINGAAGTSKITLAGNARLYCVSLTETAKSLRTVREVTGATDTILDTDGAGQVTYNRSSAIAVTVAQAGASRQFLKGWCTFVRNNNTGAVTITPTTSTINGASTLVLQNGDSALIVSDGTNYTAVTWQAGAVRYDRSQSLSASQKSQFRRNVSGGTRTITGTDTIVADDHGRLLLFNSATAFTLAVTAAATLGNGFWCRFRNINSGVITIDPDGSETIDGATTTDIPKSDSGEIHCNGSALYTINRPSVITIESGTVSSAAEKAFTLPAGFERIEISCTSILPATAGATLNGTISADGGSTYASTNYGYKTMYVNESGASGVANNATSTTLLQLAAILDDNSAYAATLLLEILEADSSTSAYKQARWISQYVNNTSGVGLQVIGSGTYYGGTSRWTNFKLAMSSGNIASMRYTMRGYRK